VTTTNAALVIPSAAFVMRAGNCLVKPNGEPFVIQWPAIEPIDPREASMNSGLFAVAAASAVLMMVEPASAATMGGCSSANLTKTQTMVEKMADGPQKAMMEREVGMANDAIAKGNMRACAMHISHVARMGTMGQQGMMEPSGMGPGGMRPMGRRM
jgi:hypothetical protein